MASNIAFVSSTTKYAYVQPCSKGEGVVLTGPLGSKLFWEDGTIDEIVPFEGFHTEKLQEAQKSALSWATK